MTAANSLRLSRLGRALFGIATRRAVADYLKMTALITFILLMVAWTIDLAEHFPNLRRAADDTGTPILSLLLPYLGQRGVDILARMLPISCFFGVFLAEIARRARLETVVLVTAGASPLRMSVAILWVGLALGITLDALEARWRPAAVWAQVETGFGDYAGRFRQGWIGGEHWFVSGGTAVKGKVFRTAEPRMRDVLIFQGIEAPRLTAIYSAQTMTPGAAPFEWTLRDGTLWQPRGGDGQLTTFDEVTLTLDLVPESLTFLGVPEFYLPQAALKALTALPASPRAPKVEVALWRRMTVWLAPVSFALLAMVLAHSGYSGRQIMIPRLIGLAALGYTAVVLLKVFWALGDLGVLSAPAATLGAPFIGFAIAAVFLWRMP